MITERSPFEKAQELIEKYKPYVYCYAGSGYLTGSEDEDVILLNAKKCAIIAIESMLPYFPWTPMEMQYWDEVKKSIVKYERSTKSIN